MDQAWTKINSNFSSLTSFAYMLLIFSLDSTSNKYLLLFLISQSANKSVPKNTSSPRPVSLLPPSDFVTVEGGAVPVAVAFVLPFTRALDGTANVTGQPLSYI